MINVYLQKNICKFGVTIIPMTWSTIIIMNQMTVQTSLCMICVNGWGIVLYLKNIVLNGMEHVKLKDLSQKIWKI